MSKKMVISEGVELDVSEFQKAAGIKPKEFGGLAVLHEDKQPVRLEEGPDGDPKLSKEMKSVAAMSKAAHKAEQSAWVNFNRGTGRAPELFVKASELWGEVSAACSALASKLKEAGDPRLASEYSHKATITSRTSDDLLARSEGPAKRGGPRGFRTREAD